MKGIVTEAEGKPNPHSFQIKNDDGEVYFAHLGDLKKNEDKLYGKTSETEFLKKGDKVEFEPVKNEQDRAIHVKKVQ